MHEPSDDRCWSRVDPRPPQLADAPGAGQRTALGVTGPLRGPLKCTCACVHSATDRQWISRLVVKRLRAPHRTASRPIASSPKLTRAKLGMPCGRVLTLPRRRYPAGQTDNVAFTQLFLKAGARTGPGRARTTRLAHPGAALTCTRMRSRATFGRTLAAKLAHRRTHSSTCSRAFIDTLPRARDHASLVWEPNRTTSGGSQEWVADRLEDVTEAAFPATLGNPARQTHASAGLARNACMTSWGTTASGLLTGTRAPRTTPYRTSEIACTSSEFGARCSMQPRLQGGRQVRGTSDWKHPWASQRGGHARKRQGEAAKALDDRPWAANPGSESELAPLQDKGMSVQHARYGSQAKATTFRLARSQTAWRSASPRRS